MKNPITSLIYFHQKRINQLRDLNSLVFYELFKKKNKRIEQVLKNNNVLFNIQNGNRCFIFGNGPSIKQLDFSLFQNEFVFTVNQLVKNPNFSKLSSNIHFWADRSFFIRDDSEAGKQLLEAMKKTKESGIATFYPIQDIDFIKNNDLLNSKTFFHYSSGMQRNKDKRFIDFSGRTPGFATVVQWCIALAVYMGFKEIYLLGCDNTAIIQTYNAFLDNDVDGYAYEVSEQEKQRIKNLVSAQSLEAYTISHLRTFEDYRILKKYCDRRCVKLVNCTPKSLIDCLPKENVYDVLARPKK